MIENQDTMRIKVQIPHPRLKYGGALLTDMDSGREIPATSLDLHIDGETMQPEMTLTFASGNGWLDMEGTFRFERIDESKAEQ